MLSVCKLELCRSPKLLKSKFASWQAKTRAYHSRVKEAETGQWIPSTPL